MIRFENVTKRYIETEPAVLREVNFHIPPCGMAFLLGESGSGKTTILRLLLRELQADEGKVYVNGRDISKIKTRKLPEYRRKMGFIFQDFKLMGEQTVYDNVAIAKRITGAKEKDVRAMVTMALRTVGMEKDFYKPVAELSGGEQQKVCVARAIAGNPCCILADEPTGNLDSGQAREIMLLLERIHRMGITVLIATHDMEAVSGMNYPRLYLENGGIWERK